ncbi:MAG TPA: M3 family metallopeptidase, partial [Clostridia bacterium]
FYVFKYATGFSAAVAFHRMIEAEGLPAVDRYLGFLGAGGSDYPLEILHNAGLDMTDPETVRTALDQFGDLVTQLEWLLD